MANKEENDIPEVQAPPKGKVKKPRKGSYYEVNTSIRKINVLRESNVNFASHFALICSVVFMINTGSIIWKATRPVPKAKVYMQHHEEAEIMRELTVFNKRTLGAPIPYEKPVDVEKIIGEFSIETELGAILPRPVVKNDENDQKEGKMASETGIVEGQAPATAN